MPVYFVYRSFDMGPTGKYLKRFEDDSILDWFRRHWIHLAVEDRLTEVVGCDGWFLCNPFAAAEDGTPPPERYEQLVELFQGTLGDNFRFDSPHALQVFTEDDGEGGAVFYFDGHFLEQTGGLAPYLLHTDWRLPSGQGDGNYTPVAPCDLFEPSGNGPGATYAVFLARESKYPLDDLCPGDQINGVRLPDLAQHFCSLLPLSVGYLRFLPPLLLAGLESSDPLEKHFVSAIQSDPNDRLAWSAWSDWRQDRGGESPGVGLLRSAFQRLGRFPGRRPDEVPQEDDVRVACRRLIDIEAGRRGLSRPRSRSLIHVEEHLAQICLDVAWTEDEPYFDQWIFFDDIWASAHPDLADAILRFSA